jgi:MYXO-CTERM domain-containing protein
VRRLLVAAGVVAVAVPPLLVVLGQALTGAGADDALLPSLLVTGYYPALLWLAVVLVGLAVGRLDVDSGAVRRRLAVAGLAAVVVGYGGGWLSTRLLTGGVPSAGPEAGFGVPGVFSLRWLSGAEPHSGTTFDVVGSTGFAVLVIVACLRAAERLPRICTPFAAVGAMALTVYSLQLVAIRVLGEVEPGAPSGAVTWLWFALAALAGATAWRRLVGRGPLEWLLTWTSSRAAGLVPPTAGVRGRPDGPP